MKEMKFGLGVLTVALTATAFGLDLRLGKGGAVEVVDDGGTMLVSFDGVDAQYEKKEFFGNGRPEPVKDGFVVTYAVPKKFPETYAKPTVTGRFVRRGDLVSVEYRLSGVSTNDPFKSGLCMIGRRYAKGMARGGGFSKGGYWVRDPNGGQPWERPLGQVVNYTNAVGGLKYIYSVGEGANQDWQDGWRAHVNFVKEKTSGDWVASFRLADVAGGRSDEVIALADAGRPAAVSITTPCVYNLFGGRKPLRFTAKVLNALPDRRKFGVSWWVRGFGGEMVSSGRRTCLIAPGESVQIPVEFDPNEDRGLYFAEVSAKEVESGREAFARTNLARVPPYRFKSTPETSPFGIAAYWPIPDEESVQKLLDRMGVMWVRGGDTRKQHPPRRANHHSSADLRKLTGEKREEWIEKQLAGCRERGNEYWEFGNEFNMSTAGIALKSHGIGRALLAEDYVGFVRDIVRIRKEKGYEDVKLLSLGLAGHDGTFISRIHELGAWDHLDGFCLHPGRGNFTADYPYIRPERKLDGSAATDDPSKAERLEHSSFWNFLGSVRATERQIERYGKIPLWLTEVYTPTFPNSWWEDTLRASAENTMLSYALIKADGVKCGFYYQLFDSVWYNKLGINPNDREYYFGMLNRDLSPKPALMAYMAIAEAMDGAEFAGWVETKDDKVHAMAFRREGGDFLVAWDRTEGYVLTKAPPKGERFRSPEPWVSHWTAEKPFEIPVVGPAQLVNAIGQVRTVKPGKASSVTVALTGAPVIVRNVDLAKITIR